MEHPIPFPVALSTLCLDRIACAILFKGLLSPSFLRNTLFFQRKFLQCQLDDFIFDIHIMFIDTIHTQYFDLNDRVTTELIYEPLNF